MGFCRYLSQKKCHVTFPIQLTLRCIYKGQDTSFEGRRKKKKGINLHQQLVDKIT